MSRIPLIFAAMIFLSLASSSAAQDKSPDANIRENQGALFATATGGFEARFPDKPSEQRGVLVVGGKVVRAYQYSTRRPDYGVIYFELTENQGAAQTVDLLKGLTNTLLTETKGSVVNDKDYSVQGEPGRMLEIKAANGDAVYGLFLVSDARVYRVTATVPHKTLPETFDSVKLAAIEFLESFTIVAVKPRPEDSRYLVKEEGEVDRFLKSEAAKREKPIDYGLLNGRAVDSPSPLLPDEQPEGHYSERVEVRVLVDETGRVVAAQVVRGHPYFRSVCLYAARKARFTPPVVDGRPVKILGTLNYLFSR